MNNSNDFKKEVFLKYKSSELLKVLALLQLQPENHGKNIRLEKLIIKTINNYNDNFDRTDFRNLLADIKATCLHDYTEDPPEEFFTENLSFYTGDSIVYPGISVNSPQVLQTQLKAVMNVESHEFVSEVSQVIRFILKIHDDIAKKLGHERRMFIKNYDDLLHLPSLEDVITQKEVFFFSEESIQDVMTSLHVETWVLDYFVYNPINKVPDDNQDNPIFRRPLLKVDKGYILTLPTLELVCLNEVIFHIAEKYNCRTALFENYLKITSEDVEILCMKMGWRPVKNGLERKFDEKKLFSVSQHTFKIDEDKIAYLTVCIGDYKAFQLNVPYNEILHNTVQESVTKLKSNNPQKKILYVNVFAKHRVLDGFALSIPPIDIESYIGFSVTEFECIINNWDFTPLTFWKYSKYYDLARKEIHFESLNTHLSKFQWFKRNDESFYDIEKSCMNFLLFDFSIEGDVKRASYGKIDKISIKYPFHKLIGYLPCLKKDEHLPIYISTEVYYGVYKGCLLKYLMPIWVESNNVVDTHVRVYINAILYWLNEIYSSFHEHVNKLGEAPIVFNISLDPEYYEFTDSEYELDSTSISYSIDKIERRISFTLPAALLSLLSKPDNYGEQTIISFIIDAIGMLQESLGVGSRLDGHAAWWIVRRHFKSNLHKMILNSTTVYDMKIAEVDLADTGTICDADMSYILHHQLKLIGFNSTIKSKQDKVGLLNTLVSLHYKNIVSAIAEYSFQDFLIFLMRHHESLIQQKAHRKLTYPAKIACFSHYYDIEAEFLKTEGEIIEALLCFKILIEFTACLRPTGNKIPNRDDLDMLLARTSLLINYGAQSDSINNDLESPSMRILPSGRLGITRQSHMLPLKDFRNNIYSEELDSYKRYFHKFFNNNRTNNNNSDSEAAAYLDKVSSVFDKEIGIGLLKLIDVSVAICNYGFSIDKSVVIITEADLNALLQESIGLTDREIAGFKSFLTFKERTAILNPPKGHEQWEVYPWRYNRRLSYMLCPIVSVTDGGEVSYIIAVRHLMMSIENITAKFLDGTLKVDKHYSGIRNLIADRMKIKGKEYNEEVRGWLCNNTNLEVYQHECKISHRGFFKSEVEKGDIDILAINHFSKTIYSIECKNTFQAKIAYDYKYLLDNFLGTENKEGLITKHINRHEWLTTNKKNVVEKLKVSSDYKIISLVITKNILPLKYLSRVPIPVVSFFELTSGQHTL